MLSPKAISYDAIKVQTSPQDRMFETIEAMQRLSKMIEKKEHELAVIQMEAVALIYSLDNSDYRRLLILYYMDGEKPKDWNEVADIMGYSESRIKHFHGWALAEIESKMQKSAHESTQDNDKL